MNGYTEDPLRTLAKSYYWQAVFNRAKSLPGCIEIFENKKEFSLIQLLFLQYLEQISNLYQELGMGEKLLCDESIEDEIRANAYILYKSKNKDKQASNTNNNQSGDKLMCIPRKKVNQNGR